MAPPSPLLPFAFQGSVSLERRSGFGPRSEDQNNKSGISFDGFIQSDEEFVAERNCCMIVRVPSI